MSLKGKTVVVDVDGTVADCQHRRHLLPNHKAFLEAMDDDPVIEPIADLVRTLKAAGAMITFCSGRNEEYRERTVKWLDNANIPFDLLFMRPDGDSRPDEVVKREMLQKIRHCEFDILFTIDDRQKIVDMWRAEGLVCLQAAPSDWDTPKIQPGKLTLLVGPTGGGKSYYAAFKYAEQPACIISSDALRIEFCGNMLDQSRNDDVFAALHALVKARITSGLPAVVDATNLRDRDRKAILALAPKNCLIEYVVIDRPMVEKKRDAGWRNGVMSHGVPLIERHAQIFASNLKMILAGDGDSRVTVTDLRGDV